MFKCSVCGYIHEGDEAPEVCPKCGAPKEKFVEVSAEVSEKIRRSRYSNDLHMEMKLLMETVHDLAQSGIEDNLDPGCVKIFEDAKAFAIQMSQRIKAELETHMKKEKWG